MKSNSLLSRACIAVLMCCLLGLYASCSQAQVKTSSGFYLPAGTSSLGGYLDWLDPNPAFKGWHLGQDFKKNFGDAVVAVADGDVVLSRMDVGSFGGDTKPGGAVIVKHFAYTGKTTIVFYALYGHLQNLVPLGAHVLAGSRVGTVGHYYSTANGDIPHLHFGIHPEKLGNPATAGYTKSKSERMGWEKPLSFLQTYHPGFSVSEPILSYYNANGGLAGSYGAASSPMNSTGSGWMQTFAGGFIYYSASTGVHGIQGDILTYHESKGGATGLYRFPTSDAAYTGTGAAGSVRGLIQKFQGGFVYSSASTGTHGITGDMLNYHESKGGAAGDYGFPTSDVANTAGGFVQKFERGFVYNSANSGTHGVREPILGQHELHGGASGSWGFPIGEAVLSGDKWYQDFQTTCAIVPK